MTTPKPCMAGQEFGGLRAAEHTAQVRAEDRQERERLFGSEPRRLPLLFCSPTMELGVDIRSLNAVAMRNVPRRRPTTLSAADLPAGPASPPWS